MKYSTLPVKGTFEVLPEDMELRNWMMDVIKETYINHGFRQIETPAIENIDLLTNSEAGENLQLLFKILKRGDKLEKEIKDINNENYEEKLTEYGLRFDLTLPLSRFYANNKNDLISPFKGFQMGYVWRAERPQKGRFRQFTQCDIDILGDNSRYAEIDLLLTVTSALKKLGFKDSFIRINDRRLLKELIEKSNISSCDFDTVCISLDKLDKIGVDGVIKDLESKSIEREKIDCLINEIEKIKVEGINYFDSEEALELKYIINIISEYYNIKFDPTLVRGMGYYTGAIFEIESNQFKSSIAGGGRYDNMISKFEKDSLPAVGISIGFERIFSILKENKFKIPNKKKKLALVFMDEFVFSETIKLSEKLREYYPTSIIKLENQKKLGKKIKRLENDGFDIIKVIKEESDAQKVLSELT